MPLDIKSHKTWSYVDIPTGIMSPYIGTNWFHIQCVLSKYFLETPLRDMNPRDVDLIVVVEVDESTTVRKPAHYRLIWKTEKSSDQN